VLVNKDHPAQNIAELVTWLKAKSGQGELSDCRRRCSHCRSSIFKLKTGVPATAISYRSSNESITSLLSNSNRLRLRRDAGRGPQLSAAPTCGRLAITMPKRSPDLPNIPTLAEAGVPTGRRNLVRADSSGRDADADSSRSWKRPAGRSRRPTISRRG